MIIREGVFNDDQVKELINIHSEYCLAETSPCKAHRLELEELQSPDIRFWTLWDNNNLLGCIALRDLGARKGEIKSMHVIENQRGKGIAQLLLNHLIKIAKQMNMSWIGLETGESPLFQRAIRFYRNNGFRPTSNFADYNSENAGILLAREI